MLPRETRFPGDRPRTAKLDSEPIALSVAFIKLESDQDSANGRISVITICKVLSPEKRAVWIKSRSLIVRAMERIWRLGHAQANSARTSAITITVELPFIREVIMIRIGRDGITTKVSVIIISTLSNAPPAKPASRPTRTPTTVPIVATIRPIIKELWMASISSHTISCPILVVPSQCSAETPRLFGYVL